MRGGLGQQSNWFASKRGRPREQRLCDAFTRISECTNAWSEQSSEARSAMLDVPSVSQLAAAVGLSHTKTSGPLDVTPANGRRAEGVERHHGWLGRKKL
jgi:hypothetical protein